MSSPSRLSAIAACLLLPLFAQSQDVASRVSRVVAQYTLDQPGTSPFHLKAEIAPSFERDIASGRTGSVEIWWMSPTRWRREVRCKEFHQIEDVDGSRDWQKNEGNYLPEWLREMAIALVRPVPNLDRVLDRVKTAEVRDIAGATHISWGEISSDGTISKSIGQGIDLNNGGPLFAMSVGASADLRDPSNFHGRQVAHKVSGGFGDPEVTARVTLIEDLTSMPTDPAEVSDPILKTVVVNEINARKNLLPETFGGWPPLAAGPTDGAMLFEVLIDRTGKVAEMGAYLSDNPGLRASAEERVRAMRFKPAFVDGIPIQVVTTLTFGFKTTRPSGVENFDSAKTFFNRARQLGFPAAANGAPYVLRAEFSARSSSGAPAMGAYSDIWISDSQWRREATFGASRLIRTRSGNKTFMLADGPDAGMLRFVFKEMEPLPMTDVFYEADWRMKHEVVDGVPTIRVAMGYESPDGVLDPQARAYWFDSSNALVKAHAYGLESKRSDFHDFNGVSVARHIDVLSGGKLAIRLKVTELGPAGPVDPGIFTLKGHEWTRQFTEEVR